MKYFISSSHSNACGSGCTHRDCSSVTQQAKTQSDGEIQTSYDNLIIALNDLDTAYTNYQKAIDNQTELLEKVQKAKKLNTLLQTHIVFLRRQDAEIVGLSIDNTATKKGVR
jgi:carbonic anhydrase